MKASKFILSAAALMLLSVSAWASDKMKADIQIDHTVHVGSAQLGPGTYKMTWTESGSNARVTFSQGKKVIVTLPAQATHKSSGYHSPALRVDDVSNMLLGVDLPRVSLSFTSENAAATSSAN